MPARTRLDPLAVVEEKVAQGERLSAVDGTALFESSDLLRIGRLADRARRQRVGDDVYFVVNRHINYTNICRNRCRFCAFSRDEGEPGAYTLTVDEVLAKAREAVGRRRDRDTRRGRGASGVALRIGPGHGLGDPGVGAVRAHQGLHRFGDRAFRRNGGSCRWRTSSATSRLVGLDSLPGGGAEIFAERVREQVCPAKISGEDGWRCTNSRTAWA